MVQQVTPVLRVHLVQLVLVVQPETQAKKARMDQRVTRVLRVNAVTAAPLANVVLGAISALTECLVLLVQRASRVRLDPMVKSDPQVLRAIVVMLEFWDRLDLRVPLVQEALRVFKARRVPRDPMVLWVPSVHPDPVARAGVRALPGPLVRQDLMARRANADPPDLKGRRDLLDLRVREVLLDPSVVPECPVFRGPREHLVSRVSQAPWA